MRKRKKSSWKIKVENGIFISARREKKLSFQLSFALPAALVRCARWSFIQKKKKNSSSSRENLSDVSTKLFAIKNFFAPVRFRCVYDDLTLKLIEKLRDETCQGLVEQWQFEKFVVFGALENFQYFLYTYLFTLGMQIVGQHERSCALQRKLQSERIMHRTKFQEAHRRRWWWSNYSGRKFLVRVFEQVSINTLDKSRKNSHEHELALRCTNKHTKLENSSCCPDFHHHASNGWVGRAANEASNDVRSITLTRRRRRLDRGWLMS